MTKAVLRTKLQEAIGQLDDETMLEALYNVVHSHLQVADEDGKSARPKAAPAAAAKAGVKGGKKSR
jgi:hypothetical protein